MHGAQSATVHAGHGGREPPRNPAGPDESPGERRHGLPTR
jgi:hypothetical protein